MPRRIELQGVANLRDFGGYATACGRGLKPGRLYRSAAHHRATDADLEVLSGLGLAVIVDLRQPREREREVMRRWPGFATDVIASDWEETFPSWEVMFKDRPVNVEALRQRKLGWYGQMALASGRIEVFSGYFAALASGDKPVLIHCSAGKDRTGVLAALTHHAAGVAREDILADFLQSNERDVYARRAPDVAEQLRRITGREPDEATVWAAMAVETDYLEAAFQGIEKHFGSIDGYLDQALGFGPEARRAFEARRLG